MSNCEAGGMCSHPIACSEGPCVKQRSSGHAALKAAQTEEDVYTKALEMCAKDNHALKEAGAKLAVAALLVVTEYDGIHRMHLALADWAMAVANEGGRDERYKGTR